MEKQIEHWADDEPRADWWSYQRDFAEAYTVLSTRPAERDAEGWLPIESAPKDGTRILVELKNPLPVDGRPDLKYWHGVPFVARHNGVADDGFDIGWQFAAPVGQGGFPDNWMVGWRPLPTSAQDSAEEPQP